MKNSNKERLIYKMKIINLLGGNISNYFEKKEIHFLTLVGDSDLIKHVILDLHYADKIFVSEAFSDHNEYRPLSAVSIYTSIKIFNKSVKSNSDAVLICDSEIDSLYKKKIFKIKKSFFNLSEIVDDLFWDYLLYRPLLQFRKNNNIPIVLYFFPMVTKVDNRSDNENRLIQNATTIAKVRTELKKGLVNEIPEALKNQSFTVEQANEIISAHSKVKINGIITSADKQSQYVNVFNGARRTFYQPDEYDGTIYFFGNSRVFGIGAEDKDTIESHFQYLLNYYVEQKSISRRLVVNQANVAGRNFFKMFPLMNSMTYQTNDIVIVPGHKLNLAKKYGFIICDPQRSFDRPHNMGEVFIDIGCHINSEGNKKVAECLLQTFIENDLLSGDYQNKNGLDINDEDSVIQKNEYNILLKNYKTSLSQTREHVLGKVGSIVMNCNPFTLGHRYLIEYAASKVRHLFIFVVEEDKSVFPFKDRFELVKVGTADMENITVLPSGQFIISALTFGDYFDKTEIQDKLIDPSNDVEIFAKEIAPSLGITIRFAGEEPLDNITRQYNDAMRRILPKYDIEFEVIPRKESNGEVISASRVRKLLEARDFEAIAKLVPETTLNYLKEQFKTPSAIKGVFDMASSKKVDITVKAELMEKQNKIQESPQIVGKNVSDNNKKLKIGIISINAHSTTLNLACPLHSVVFSDVLTDLGYNNVIVNYYPHYYPKKSDLKFPLLKTLKTKDSEKKKRDIEVWTELFYQRIERYDKFQKFVERNYNFTKQEYDSILMDKVSNVEDINCYIAATDVIWKYFNKQGFEKGYFLACHAMKNSYKIAYAASRGVSKYEKIEVERKFFEYIRNINDISVREKSLEKYINSKIDIPLTVVADPVFLKDKDYYNSILVEPKHKGYVLAYLAMEDADELILLAAKYAAKNNLDLIELSECSFHKRQTEYSRHSVIYNTSVEEWLGYIKNAECIFTNSFHGCCLSIIMEKELFVGERGDKVDNVIETFDLSLRKIDKAFDSNAQQIVDKIDYIKVNRIKKGLVSRSMSFLKESLKNAEKYIKANDFIPNGYLSTGNKSECHGCTACEKVCSQNAISMIQDSEGFFFPKVNQDMCIKCGLCVSTCPYNKRKTLYFNPKEVFLAYNRDANERKNSSSGGMFAAMADYILKSGGTVVGVCFNEKWEALYDIAETYEDCLKFKYSKYVEAMDNDIYLKTKVVLDSGRKVLFTGTPCKIAGLLNYLGRVYDNLYCADILCHGTNSPMILKKYLEEKEKQQKSKINLFRFRTAKGPWRNSANEYSYEDGTTEIVLGSDDLYKRCYLKNFALKRSCFECKYCGNNGISDITFGDFWGGKKFYTEADAEKGLSCLKVNTEKGKELFDNMNIYAQPQSVEEMYKENHKKPSKYVIQRELLFSRINDENMNVIDAMKLGLTEIKKNT